MSGGVVAETRGQQRSGGAGCGVDAQLTSVEPRSVTGGGVEQLSLGGAVDDTGEHLPLPRRRRSGHSRDAGRVCRDAERVVDRAVDRVDDPRDARRAGVRAALLAEKAVIGACDGDPVTDERLDLAVGLGDDVGQGRLRRGDRHPLAATTTGEVAALSSDGDRDGLEFGGKRHASTLYAGWLR